MEVIEHHRRRPLAAGEAGPRLGERLLLHPAGPWSLLAASLALQLALWQALPAPASPLALALPWCGAALGGLSFALLRAQARRRSLAESEALRRGSEVAARSLWLDAVCDLSPNGTLVFERDAEQGHRLVFTNPAFSLLFGLRPEELLGLSESAADEWLAGLATPESPMPPLALGEATLRLAGPPQRILRRSAREDAQQRVYYFRDVTHEIEVERLKNEFLTTAAHELRTPLASVYGYAELLVSARFEPSRRQQLCEVVYRQAGVLKHLVDELLDLARIDARGDADFHREPVALQTVLDTAVESFMQPQEPLRIVLEPGAEALWVMADAAKLQQAVVNALSNALKYSDSATPVRLRAVPGRRDGARWVALQVVDQGIGMTAEQCARAFERFYRADPSGNVLGAGLGLPIVQEVINRHGGEVSLDSRPGEGTTITLHLPLLEAPAEAAGAAAARLTS